MLELKNVSKFYYSKGVVTSGFSKVNLSLSVGEFVAITGESGSGKSTLLNVLSGLDSYEEGEMFVEGEDTSAYSEKEWEAYRRKYISNIFQSFNLVNSYTVYQNVELALLLSGDRGKDRKERILEVLRKVDLYEYRNQRASRLSGGQKQRVAIARALVRNTPIIVADEPTGNLDSKAAANVIEMLSRVASDKLVLVVTHNYEQVEDYVTRRITLHDGRIIEDVPLREIARMNSEQPVLPPQEEIPEAKTAGVFEEPVRRVSAGQKLRLGVRNAFNIVPKFLLLLLVFLFVSVATAGYYASDLAAKDNATDYSYNYYYSNISRQRIIIKKTDGSAITASDFEQLRAMENVKTVYTDDLLLDNTVSLSGVYMLDGNAYALENFDGQLDYGRMPENEKEVVLCVGRNNYLSNEEIVQELMDDTLSLHDWSSDSTLLDGMKISGVMIDQESVYGESFYCDHAVLDVIRGQTNLNYSTVQVGINGKIMNSMQGGNEYRLVASDRVEPGEVMVSDDVEDLFTYGRCIGEPMTVYISNLYYETETTFTMGDTYNRYNWERKTGQPEDYYEWQNGIVLINTADYASLFTSDSYQSSVFVSDTELLQQTAQQLLDMGYTPLCMADILVDQTGGYQAVMNVLNAARTVILFIATFFVAYFVIRLIMKSRNTYFTTVRILGATRNDCCQLLFVDLASVLCAAYLLFVGGVVLVKQDVIHADFLLEFLAYLEPAHYVVLFGVLVLMCLLIALRYARKLFKASAMKTYKEVG